MLIPLGILAVAGAVTPTAAGDYDLLESVTLGTAAASISFDTSTYSALGYKHLQLRMIARSTGASGTTNYAATYCKFNNDGTSSNYKAHFLTGDGSSVTSSTWTIDATLGFRAIDIASNLAAANHFTPFIMDIVDAFAAKNKTARMFWGHTQVPIVMLNSALWINTTSLTNITLTPVASFAIGTKAAIYGLKA